MPGEVFPVAIPRNAPPEIGEGAADLRIQTIKLDDARDSVELKIKGNFIWAVTASDIQANVDVRFNDQSGDAFPVKRGASIGGLPFRRLYITNEAQAGKTITIMTVLERPRGEFRVTNPDISFNEVTLTRSTTSGDALDQSIANGVTDIITANNTRRSFVIQSLTGELRVGPNAAAGRGIKLQLGQTYSHDGSSGIRIHNESGAAGSYTYVQYFD